MESLEERIRVRSTRLGEEHLSTEPREKSGELVGVPFLVQEVGAEDEIPRRGAKQRLRLAPANACDTERRVVSLGVAAQELDRVLCPVRREHVGTAQRRRERRQTEPAAELQHLAPCDLERRHVARER